MKKFAAKEMRRDCQLALNPRMIPGIVNLFGQPAHVLNDLPWQEKHMDDPLIYSYCACLS
jgi:hypothetical protein